MTDLLQLRTWNRSQSRRRFEELRESGFMPQSSLPTALAEVREQVIAAHASVKGQAEIKQDRVVGIALYEALAPNRITLRGAADDGIWRYLSLDVFPDLVRHRNPTAGEDWFWRSKWRIWLKRVWWWVHLSWQGNKSSTAAAIQHWTTDTVAQFVERPGRGFRVELWRGIAAETSTRRIDEGHFRRAMKLNTAMLATFEPTLLPTLISPYVVRLFDVTEAPEQ